MCAGNLKALHDCDRRFTFLGGFAADPIQFTRHLVAAAAKDVRVARLGNEEEYQQMSPSEHFELPWAQDAVVQYLQRCQATGRS